MSSENNQITKKPTTPYLTTSGVSLTILGLINWLVPNIEIANKLAFIATPLGALISYLILLFNARFLITPEDMAKIQKLKRDKKKIIEIIQYAEKNQNLYSKKQIEEFKKELYQTDMLLINIGKSDNTKR